MKKAIKAILATFAVASAIFIFVRVYFYGLGSRPDVILITAQGLRADHLNSYGYERIRTGTINRLADKGLLFQNAYCNVPTPFFSYASILTGMTGSRAVVRKDNRVSIDNAIQLLSERVSASGYSTALIAADASLLPLTDSGVKGFEIVEDITKEVSGREWSSRDRIATEKAIEIIVKMKKKRRPVFVWIAYSIPLFPYTVPDDFKAAADDFPYDRQVLLLDDALSKLQAGLRRLRMSKNSVIVFTSATGESFNEHREPFKGTFIYNSTTKAPLIISFPRLKKPGKVEAPVSHADIAPTILDSLKIKYKSGQFDGKSLYPFTSGKDVSTGPVYLESLDGYNMFGWSPLCGVISGNYKYIEAPRPELYDIAEDPHELTNLVWRHQNKAIRLRDELFDYLKEKRPSLLAIINKGEDPKDKVGILSAYLMLADYLKYKDVDFLITFCEDVLKEDPKNKAFRYSLAQFHVRDNKFRLAESCLVGLTADYPDSGQAWRLLGDVYKKEGKDADAEKCYRKARNLRR